MGIYLHGPYSASDPWSPFHGTNMVLFLSVKLISAPTGRRPGCWGNGDLLQSKMTGSFSRSVTDQIRPGPLGSKVVKLSLLNSLRPTHVVS